MPRATTKTAPRVKRARTEVQEEFSAIQEEVQAARESSDAKADDLARHKESGVRQAVEGVSVDGVVEQISRLGLEINRALSGISEKLVSLSVTPSRRLADLRCKALKILKSTDLTTGNKTWFYVEFRRPLGGDIDHQSNLLLVPSSRHLGPARDGCLAGNRLRRCGGCRR